MIYVLARENVFSFFLSKHSCIIDLFLVVLHYLYLYEWMKGCYLFIKIFKQYNAYSCDVSSYI